MSAGSRPEVACKLFIAVDRYAFTVKALKESRTEIWKSAMSTANNVIRFIRRTASCASHAFAAGRPTERLGCCCCCWLLLLLLLLFLLLLSLSFVCWVRMAKTPVGL
ncbi:unnamed protein product [Polarella glacialis]|uniref:Uncharacterized protein n=1 Tax=Polarella glacialis TaxID=89957 RepID=A0A813FSV5_POLGL|nr:unnamed protein product [Polarella glacialis]